MTATEPSIIFRLLQGQALGTSVVWAAGWALLGWAKLSRLGYLPKEAAVQYVLQEGSSAIEDALSQATMASDDQLLSDLSPLKGLEPTAVEALVHTAWDIVRCSDLEGLSLERVLSRDGGTGEPGELLASLVPSDFGILPPELSLLMAALGDVKAGNTVYAPWDVYAQQAVAVHRLGAVPYIETPTRQNVTRLIQLLANLEAPVHFTDPVVKPTALTGGALTQFDVALACPPIGLRYARDLSQDDDWRRFPEQTSSSPVLVVRHLLAQAKRRVVVLVPNTLLSGAGAEAQLRKDLVRRGVIQAVLAMPKGLLPAASVATAVLVLDPRGGHECVRFIDVAASPFYKSVSKTRWRLVDPICLARHVQETTLPSLPGEAIRTRLDVLEADTLQVSRHLAQASAALAPYSPQPLVRLKDLVHTVRSLHPTLRKTESSAGIAHALYEVGAQDLPSHGYIGAVQRLIEVPDSLLAQVQSLHLRPLDIVLIVKGGGAGKVGIVPSDVLQSPQPWIVGQSGIVLRMDASEILDARTLFLLLRSREGQLMLQGIVVGATTPLIQLRELMELTIQMPTSRERAEAVEALAAEDELQHQIDQLRNAQAAVAANLWTQP